jgi:NADPH2:quinone reductase
VVPGEEVAVRAVQVVRLDGPGALEVNEVDEPKAGDDQVLIDVEAAGVVFPDLLLSRGEYQMKPELPFVLGSEVAGTVREAPEGSRFSAGDRVAALPMVGGFAPTVASPTETVFPLPDAVSFDIGAGLPMNYLTAHFVLETRSHLAAGETVLVHGAAGGVGIACIQFAKARGATVITTVSSEEKAKLARQAGADHVIDYKRENVGARVKGLTDGRGVDAVLELDLAANAKLIPEVLRPKGLIVVYGTSKPMLELPAYFCLTNQIRLQFIFVYELTQAERERTVGEIQKLIAADKLIHNVALTFPLNDIVAAHEAVEQGRVAGNVVVRI